MTQEIVWRLNGAASCDCGPLGTTRILIEGADIHGKTRFHWRCAETMILGKIRWEIDT